MTDISEFFQAGWVYLDHFNYKRNGREQDTMVSVCQEILCFRHKVIREVRHFTNYAQGAKSSLTMTDVSKLYDPTDPGTHLLSDICVTRAQQLLNFVRQVARHLLRRNIRKRTQGKSDRVHVRMVHVTNKLTVNGQYTRLRSTHFFNEFVTSVRTS